MTALATTYAGTEGVKNLFIQDFGKLILENIGVKTCPAKMSVVRMFGVLYLQVVIC